MPRAASRPSGPQPARPSGITGASPEDEWDTELTSWRESPSYVPDYWQVAWDGDQVAGMVLNFIDTAENEENHRLRGYTGTICVRRPWRRRGLARA